MLMEISCDRFVNRGARRPPICFHKGLNTVLGGSDGANSIGKSTLLMIIDFAFGGSDYIGKGLDVQNNIGPHRVNFAFQFHGERHYFCRDTDLPKVVWRCDETYNPLSEMGLEAYTDFLFAQYEIELPLTTFRNITGRAFRIYKRDNLDEMKPLNAVKKETEKDAVAALMKLFSLYEELAQLEQAVKKSQEEKKIFQKAQSLHYLPKIGKRQFMQNLKAIAELEATLAQMQEKMGDELLGLKSAQAEEIVRLKQALATARRKKSRFLSQKAAMERESALDTPVFQKDFADLLRFFPNANQERLGEIESFHSQVADLLQDEWAQAKENLELMIQLADREIHLLEKEIQAKGLPEKISKVALGRYSELKNCMDTLEKENQAYLDYERIREAAKTGAAQYESLLACKLDALQNRLNNKMKQLNDVIYGGEKHPPALTISPSRSYQFLTPDDTGTGTSYKGLVVFDLSLLEMTPLPALVHDSVVLKQIANDPLEKIMELYRGSSKQIFIAMDKAESYSPATQRILADTAVIRLGSDGEELFGWSWGDVQDMASATLL